jgi:hypothetical protein
VNRERVESAMRKMPRVWLLLTGKVGGAGRKLDGEKEKKTGEEFHARLSKQRRRQEASQFTHGKHRKYKHFEIFGNSSCRKRGFWYFHLVSLPTESASPVSLERRFHFLGRSTRKGH